MSMYLEFEPHSWYMGAAIKKWDGVGYKYHFNASGYKWEAYIEDGNHYTVNILGADTLKDLKDKIKEYYRVKREYTDRIYKELDQ